jgi:hypothetical protein
VALLGGADEVGAVGDGVIGQVSELPRGWQPLPTTTAAVIPAHITAVVIPIPITAAIMTWKSLDLI